LSAEEVMVATIRTLVCVLVLCLGSLPALARELAVDVDEMVEVEIATIAMSVSGAPVVLLREPNAREVIPITIGPSEAQAILRAMESVETPRPMTHDLFGDLLSGLDASLERVFVDDLVSNTYLGALEVRVEGREEPILIDSRPSDSMAIAIRTGASIFVAPSVLAAAEDIRYRGLEDEVVTAMGITVSELSPDLRQALELPEEREGLLVTGVRGPASEEGLEPGALLLRINGEPVENPMAFLDQVHETPEGELARLVFWQDGTEREIEVDTAVPDTGPPRSEFDPDEGISL